MQAIIAAIEAATSLPPDERAALFNQASTALGALVADLIDAPCLSPQLVAAAEVRANDYNPNSVAPPEMALLEDSIRADGVTMGVVVYPLPDGGYEVVDGYHRRRVLTERMSARYLPVVFIRSDRGDRIASTVRHNRARGKHSVDKMAQEIVAALLREGWTDTRIATHLGMSAEEVLRLRQIGKCAAALAAPEYSQPWRRGDAPENPAHK